MSAFSHFISVLLSIGAFLGLPYAPGPVTLPPHIEIETKVQLPAIEKTEDATTSISRTPTSTKKKLPTLALHAPAFAPVSTTPPAFSAQAPIKTPAPLPPVPTIIPQETPPLGPVQEPTLLPSNPPNTPLSQLTSPPVSSSNPSKAIVNIYCTTRNGNTITAVTGSGIVIDPRGIILTNAHVAEHILLTNYLEIPNKECVIRQGSPAVALYKAEMIYIPESWLRDHGDEINQMVQSQESGEGDYALLGITNSISASLPNNFPHATPDISTNYLRTGSSVRAISYPSGNFASDQVSIINNYSFSQSGADLIRTSATELAERGASGGGILNKEGRLIGLIVTTTPDEHGSGNDLQALTLNYINRDLQRSARQTLSSFLAPGPTSLVNNFKNRDEDRLISYLPH